MNRGAPSDWVAPFRFPAAPWGAGKKEAMREMTTLTLHEARERLRNTIEEYVRLDAELRALENTNYRVCIFGSARIKPRDPVYHAVFALAQGLSQQGIDVVTGGGPGLMEAANRGVLAAKRGRSQSYGLPLDLPSLVEPPNRALDVRSAHKRFSSRLDEFIRLSHAVVVAPGGVGTLLELAYTWQLLQLDTIEPRPFILLGRAFWEGLLEWLRAVPGEQALMSRRDLDALTVVDRPQEALEIIGRDHAAFRHALLTQPEAPESEALRLREAAEALTGAMRGEMDLTHGAVDRLLPAAA